MQAIVRRMGLVAVWGLTILSVTARAAPSTGFKRETYNVTGWDYNDTNNWVGGVINGIWHSSYFNTGWVYATFASNTVLSTGLQFLHSGNNNVELWSDSSTPRTLTLGGDVIVNYANYPPNIGHAVYPVHVELGGDRVFYVNTSKSFFIHGEVHGVSCRLTKTGAGTVWLNGTNFFDGGLTVSGGVVAVTVPLGEGGTPGGVGAAGPAASNLVLNGGTLELRNYEQDWYTDRLFTIGPAGGTLLAKGSSAMSLTNNGAPAFGAADTPRTLTLGGGNTNGNTLACAIGDNGTGVTTLIKTDAGRWRLTGANTFSGPVIVSNGVLNEVDGEGFLATGGNLTLTANGVWESAADMIRPAGSGAGQMRITGGTSGFRSAGGAVSAVFGTLGAPDSLTWGTAPFQPGTLVLDGDAAGAALDFRNNVSLGAAQRTVQVNAGRTATMSGILGGSGGLTKTGEGRLVLSVTNSYTGPTTNALGVLQVSLGASPTLPSGRLVFAGNAADKATVLQSNGEFTRALGTGTGQVSWVAGRHGGFSAHGGGLDVNIGNAAHPSALIWNSTASFVGTGRLHFNSETADGVLTFRNGLNLNNSNNVNALRYVYAFDNPATKDDSVVMSGVISSSASTAANYTRLYAYGPGLLWLTATNTYGKDTGPTNGTYVCNGVLRAVEGVGVPTNALINFYKWSSVAGVFETHGTFTRSVGTGRANVSWGASFTGGGGFSAWNGDDGDPAGLTVNLGNAFPPSTLTWGAANFVQDGGLAFNSVYANRVVEFRNNLDLNDTASAKTRTIRVTDNADDARDYALLSGVVSMSGTGGGATVLAKTGDGLLMLSNTNPYAAATRVEGGTLAAHNTTNSAFTVMSNATLIAAGTMNKLLTVEGGGTLGAGTNVQTVGTLTLTQGLTLTANAVLELGVGTGSDLIRITGGTFSVPDGGKVYVRVSDAGGFGQAGRHTIMDWTEAAGVVDVDPEDFRLHPDSPIQCCLAVVGTTLRAYHSGTVLLFR